MRFKIGDKAIMAKERDWPHWKGTCVIIERFVTDNRVRVRTEGTDVFRGEGVPRTVSIDDIVPLTDLSKVLYGE